MKKTTPYLTIRDDLTGLVSDLIGKGLADDQNIEIDDLRLNRAVEKRHVPVVV